MGSSRSENPSTVWRGDRRLACRIFGGRAGRRHVLPRPKRGQKSLLKSACRSARVTEYALTLSRANHRRLCEFDLALPVCAHRPAHSNQAMLEPLAHSAPTQSPPGGRRGDRRPLRNLSPSSASEEVALSIRPELVRFVATGGSPVARAADEPVVAAAGCDPQENVSPSEKPVLFGEIRISYSCRQHVRAVSPIEDSPRRILPNSSFGETRLRERSRAGRRHVITTNGGRPKIVAESHLHLCYVRYCHRAQAV